MSVHTYEGDSIIVSYDAKVCIHAGACVKNWPQLFDVQRKPWVVPSATTLDEAQAFVKACPSGALSARAK
jgi:uncharacterized Fe-S cluster protein YjdI